MTLISIFQGYLHNINWLKIIDITIVVFILGRLIAIFKNSRAIEILKGILLIYLLRYLARTLGLVLFSDLLSYSMTLTILSVPIIFQNEIKTALERFAKSNLIFKNEQEYSHTINELLDAIKIFHENKTGVLIVIEQKISLADYINTGVLLNSDISVELLRSIFENESALHDGAVIIRTNKIISAKSILPLTSTIKKANYGTRHRSAIGLSEATDAIVVIVSEETGNISIARHGHLGTYGNYQTFCAKFPKVIKKYIWLHYYKERFKNIKNIKAKIIQLVKKMCKNKP